MVFVTALGKTCIAPTVYEVDVAVSANNGRTDTFASLAPSHAISTLAGYSLTVDDPLALNDIYLTPSQDGGVPK